MVIGSLGPDRWHCYASQWQPENLCKTLAAVLRTAEFDQIQTPTRTLGRKKSGARGGGGHFGGGGGKPDASSSAVAYGINIKPEAKGAQ